MAFTKKQIVIALSIAVQRPLHPSQTSPSLTRPLQYLLALTIIAAYALHSSTTFSLPIPNAIPALTIALPPLAGIALETCISLNEKLAARGQLQASRVFQLTIAFFLVYETVLATLAGTHIAPPGSLNCALKERWLELFRAKDEGSVRRIQDAFQCCGLGSVRDMAWPFPSAERGADACVRMYGRQEACLGAWRGEERKVGIMLLVVPVAVFLWMVRLRLPFASCRGWTDRSLGCHRPRADDAVRVASITAQLARERQQPRCTRSSTTARHRVPRPGRRGRGG